MRVRFAWAAAAGVAILSGCGNARSSVAKEVPAGSYNDVDALAVATQPAASPSSRGSGVLAQCPATLGAPGRPVGARVFGKTTVGSLPLSDAVIGMVAVKYYDPAVNNLNEFEADDIEGKVNTTAADYSYSPDSGDVSLACRYGKRSPPLSGEAMLLIPLKPQWARCRLVLAKGTKPASMTCRPTKPEE